MSEPVSIYLRVNITKDNLNKFLNSPVKNVKDYSDWEPWIEGRVYGDVSKFIEERNQLPNSMSNVAFLKKNVEHFRYNENEEIFVLDNIFYSESWEVIIDIFACLRGLETYIKPDTFNNFFIVYPYWWGDTELEKKNVLGYMYYEGEKSILCRERKMEDLIITQNFYTEFGESLAQEYIEKYGKI